MVHQADRLSVWPKSRDPKAPPFFVDLSDRRGPLLAGTFRTGVCSLFAIPRNIPNQRWHGFLSIEEAIDAADFLNDLHDLEMINWENDGISPIIIQSQDPEITQYVKSELGKLKWLYPFPD